MLGWKEYEMEVVRDKDDNCIIVCSIENIDPMGVHTGNSITVAPALTLTDKEYQIMRNASIKVLREIGVETGGSNVQFAVNPADGRLVIIEMNPRVSRSSALASKATGFPIAKIAAKLAVGYTLDELANDITGGATPASFEPTIDYVVTKIPRFAFEKFPGSKPVLTTSMKSVGEAMAIGRTFPESLQKALRSMETGLTGLDDIAFEGLGQGDDKNVIREALGTPSPDRLLKVAQALRLGVDHEQIYDSCKIDPWFIEQLQDIIDCENRVRAHGLPKDAANFRALKAMGFSDERLAKLSGIEASEVAARRRALDVHPVYKRIDTCAAEFASPTAYMYSTYESGFAGRAGLRGAAVATRKRSSFSGGGSQPHRPGHRVRLLLLPRGLRAVGGRLRDHHDQLQSGDGLDRLRHLRPPLFRAAHRRGRAGDRPHRGAKRHAQGRDRAVRRPDAAQARAALENAKVPILGTSPDAIDLAEDRDRFKALIERLGIRQPRNGIARSAAEAKTIAAAIGFPVVIRPSYVLGGRAMEIVHDEAQLARYIAEAVVVSGKSPVLINSYLRDAIEVDVDALADGKDVFICGVMEHIEEAGVHSGDSACSLPPHSLSLTSSPTWSARPCELARALSVVGLMNVQFAIQNDDIYILEVNPRASRTVPFVAKVIGLPVAGIAAEVMAGKPLAAFGLKRRKLEHVAVKEAVFPFARFPGVDPVLGPEMRSTGEVMGIDRDYAIAFAKSQLGGGSRLPLSGTVFVSVKDSDKDKVVGPVQRTRRDGLPHHRHARHQASSRCARHPVREGQQGARGAPACGRRHHQWRGGYRVQHHRGRQGARQLVLDPPLGLALPHPLLYNARRRARRDRGYQGAQGGGSQSRSPTELCRPARQRSRLRRLEIRQNQQILDLDRPILGH